MNETMIKGWESKEFGLITEFIRNGFNADQEDEGLYPVSRIETISNGVVDFSRVKYTSTMSDENIKKYMINYNDILFSHINSPSHVGKTAIYKENKPLLHGANLLAIRVKKAYSADYVNAYLKQLKQQNYFLVRCNKAVNQASIKQSEIAKILIPFPPLPQQEKIVSVLDTASALVEKQKALLEKYDLFLKSKFIEMFGDPVKNLMGWKIRTLNEVGESFKYGTNEKSYESIENGILILRIPNVGDRKIVKKDLKYSKISSQEAESIRLKQGDLLFVRSNGNPSYIGKCISFNEDLICGYASYLIRVRLKPNTNILSRYIEFILSMPTYRQKIIKEAKTTAGNYNINTVSIKKFTLLAPPIELQIEFIQIVEQVEILKQKEQLKLEKLQTLYNALMDRAFKGEIR